MPRGGQRQGKVGAQYPNRSDLQSGTPVAVQTAPDQTYGVAKAQQVGQKEVPVAASPNIPTSPQGPNIPAGAPRPQPLQPTSPEPGELDWTGPSNRPNEPLMHGAPGGEGAGPDVLTGIGAIANRTQPHDTAAKLLVTLAMQPTAGSQLRNLARAATMTGAK